MNDLRLTDTWDSGTGGRRFDRCSNSCRTVFLPDKTQNWYILVSSFFLIFMAVSHVVYMLH